MAETTCIMTEDLKSLEETCLKCPNISQVDKIIDGAL